MIDDDSDAGETQRNYKKWVSFYDEFLDLNESYKKEYCDSWFSNRDLVMVDFKFTLESAPMAQ